MTREEAKEALSVLKIYDNQWLREAIDMAIEALSAVCDDCIWHVCNYNKVDWDADVVSKGVFDQVKWERDTALKTLEDHGIGLGQKPKTGWIPVSERLPDERQDVYVTVLWDDYGDYITAYGMRTKFGWNLHSNAEGELIKGYTVVAWMPLPEPYKGGDVA